MDWLSIYYGVGGKAFKKGDLNTYCKTMGECTVYL